MVSCLPGPETHRRRRELGLPQVCVEKNRLVVFLAMCDLHRTALKTVLPQGGAAMPALGQICQLQRSQDLGAHQALLQQVVITCGFLHSSSHVTGARGTRALRGAALLAACVKTRHVLIAQSERAQGFAAKLATSSRSNRFKHSIYVPLNSSKPQGIDCEAYNPYHAAGFNPTSVRAQLQRVDTRVKTHSCLA